MLPGYPAGVAATSPPYPTPGWATTQVYPAEWLLTRMAPKSMIETYCGVAAPVPIVDALKSHGQCCCQFVAKLSNDTAQPHGSREGWRVLTRGWRPSRLQRPVEPSPGRGKLTEVVALA